MFCVRKTRRASSRGRGDAGGEGAQDEAESETGNGVEVGEVGDGSQSPNHQSHHAIRSSSFWRPMSSDKTKYKRVIIMVRACSTRQRKLVRVSYKHLHWSSAGKSSSANLAARVAPCEGCCNRQFYSSKFLLPSDAILKRVISCFLLQYRSHT